MPFRGYAAYRSFALVEAGPAKTPPQRGFRLIGETGFEPATARPPAGCATRLRHSPWLRRSYSRQPEAACRAGDGNRTRPKSLEGFCATTTLRPRGARE